MRDRAKEVERYYDEWTPKYLEIYGETIQAYRPASQEQLLDYTIESAGLQDGMKILDAGCGVCGPAIHFASKLNVEIEAITISGVQVEDGRKRIEAAGVDQKVNVQKGDYHEMDQLFDADTFDMVMFLEALGHAGNPRAAIEAAAKLTKPGGFIYLKDFFPIETQDPKLKQRVKEVIGNINELYTYNTLDLHETLTALRENGFLIVFIKRPEYESDIGIRKAFEDKFGIDTHGGKKEFMPAEWLEIKCQKIWWDNGGEE